jgi:hypothetical protein
MQIFLLMGTISHIYTILLFYSLMRAQIDNMTLKTSPLSFLFTYDEMGRPPHIPILNLPTQTFLRCFLDNKYLGRIENKHVHVGVL